MKLWEEVHPDNVARCIFTSGQDVDDQVVPVKELKLAKDVENIKHTSLINQWAARTVYPVFRTRQRARRSS